MWLHLGVALLTVAAFGRLGLPGRPARAALVLPAAAFVAPLGVVAALGPDEALFTGTEGVLEAVTVGVLATLLVGAARAREVWIGLAAGVLLLEEVDYGQLFLGFDTPAWVLGLESRSDRLNFHNLAATDWVWKPGPVVATLLCTVSWGRLESLRDRLCVPRFGKRAWIGLAGLGAAGLGASLVLDERRFGEALELALATWALVSWDPRRTARRPG